MRPTYSTALSIVFCSAISASAAMPEYLTHAFHEVRWIAYSPTGASSSPSSLGEMRKDLETIHKNGFGGIVTYGCDGLKKEIPQLAHTVGIKYVILGVYNPASEEEMSNAKDLAHWVDGYCVGNEGIGKESRYRIEQLQVAISELRKWSGRPVTTSEQIEDYFEIPQLLELGDWLFPNVHPFWNGKQTEPDASRWTRDQVNRLREKAPTSFIICKELGLPTGSLDEGVQTPSERVQADYYLALRALDVPFVYFEAFDQTWKRHHPVEPYWGIFRSDRTPKLVVSLLASALPGVQFTNLRDKGTARVLLQPDGGFLEVRGTAAGLDASGRELVLFVSTGDFTAPGWFLQLPPNGITDVRPSGEWTARAQIGNAEYPPRRDQRIGLRVLAVSKDDAAKLIQQRMKTPDTGIYSQDFPKVDPQWSAEVREIELQIERQASAN